MKQVTKRIVDIKLVEKPEDRTGFIEFLESVYRFFVGSLSGLIGAGSVYPIDLIKTRMMNQRNSKEMISRAHAYHDTMDCVMKTLRCSISLGHRAKIPSDSIPFSNLKASGIGSMKNIPQSGSCTKSQILYIKC